VDDGAGVTKLLFLANRFPYPTHSGADIRTYNVWRELARDWNVEAIVLHNSAEDVPGLSMEQRVAALSELGTVRVVPLEAQRARTRMLAAHARAFLHAEPYVNQVFGGPVFADALEQHLARTRYDVIHVDGISLMHNFRGRPSSRVVLTHHNIESDLLDRRAAFVGNPVLSAYMRLQARRLRATEAYWAARVAMNICVSREDAVRLREIAPTAKLVEIPNAVDDSGAGPVALGERRQGGLFVGGLNWFPNADALAYYAQDIEPLFGAGAAAFPTTWVGKAGGAQVAEYAGHRSIRVVGHAPSLRPHTDAARVFIAPLRVGGGTRLKILDAWAAGLPVVATALACEGLGVTSGKELLIANTPDEFVNRVRQLVTDDRLWLAVASHARARLQADFSWAALGPRLRAHYAEVAGRAASGTG
jgi:glycosyltransferase involved in cell wall biosynthesis